MLAFDQPGADSKRVTVGLIGCGLVTLGVHLKNLSRIPGVELRILAEPDTKRRSRAVDSLPGLLTTEDPCILLEDSTLDAVIVSVPYEQHASAAQAALSAGKHVYLEKPFATSLADAQQLYDFWRRPGSIGSGPVSSNLAGSGLVGSSLIGMMGFNYRFHPHVQALRDMLRSGNFGRPTSLRHSFSFAPHGGKDWEITCHGEAGALFDLGSHSIDLARFLLDAEIEEVLCNPQSLQTRNDTLCMELRMTGGMLAQSFLSTNCVEEHRLAVYTTSGSVSVDLYQLSSPVFRPQKASHGRLTTNLRRMGSYFANLPFAIEKLRSPWQEASFLRAMRAFVQAIRENRQAAPSFGDGYASQLVIAAGVESLENRRFATVQPLCGQSA